MMITKLLWIAFFLFPASEILLAILKRAKPGNTRTEDRGSLRMLWLVILASLALASSMQWVKATQLAIAPALCNALALGLLLMGLAIRWTSILHLGHLFTVDVAIHDDHALIQNGLYRYVRHPSYSGLLVAFLGIAVYSANWLCMGLLLVPITIAILRRIAVEEAALLEELGDIYVTYCARTKRLVPGLL
jgi:protein-S-isoprenylcysteine O-methyltransferase